MKWLSLRQYVWQPILEGKIIGNYNLGRYILITIHLKNMAKKFNKRSTINVNRSTQNVSCKFKWQYKISYSSTSYRVCDEETKTSTPSDSSKRLTDSSRLRGNGSPSYSNVTLDILHFLISFGKTSMGCPLTIKSREPNFRSLESKSFRQSRRKRHLFLEMFISFKESTSRKNTPLNVELPSIAWRREGLSCKRRPLRNQWIEFTSADIA